MIDETSQGRSFGLLRYFTIASLLAFCVVAVLLGLLYHRSAVSELIAIEEVQNARIARSLANTRKNDFAFFIESSDGLTAEALRASSRVASLRRSLAEQLAGINVYKVKLYNLKGRTVYSTDPNQIGEDHSDHPGFKIALSGEMASQLTHKAEMSTFEGTVTDIDLVATYLPLMSESGEVEGAFELYSDVTQLLSEISSERMRIIGIVSVILGLLYIALLLIVRYADAVIIRQRAAKEVAEDALLEARQDLERRVRERTGDLTVANRSLAEEMAERGRLDEERERLVHGLEALAEAASILLEADEAGEAVPKVLALMGSVAEASRCYWLGNMETVDGHPIPVIGTRWRADHQNDPLGWNRSLEELPALGLKVAQGEVAQVKLDDVTPAQRKVFDKDGTKALMLMPVHVHGRWVGCVGFDDCRRPRVWQGGVLTTLQSMVHSLALAVGRWVNERQRIELAAAVEQAAEGVMITDIDGRIRYVNAAYLEMTGTTTEQVMGGYLEELDASHDAHEVRKEVLECLARGEVWRGLREIKLADGTVANDQVVISSLSDASGAVIGHVVLHNDVTEEERMRQRLYLAQRMESVGQLAGGIAHDFNNMITIIMGATQLIRLRHEDNAEEDEDLEAIERAARSAGELTRGMLAFARRQPLQREELDVAAFVAGMRPMLRSLLPESVHLKLSSSEGLPMVMADRSEFEQVVVNLCINAKDAMPLGGIITVKVDQVEIDAEFLSTKPWAQSGTFVRLGVSDTGIGMSEDTAARIFEPFFTTKEAGKGTGLGLATVYGVIKQHEGMIDVDSKEGQGTSLTVYLPASEPGGEVATPEERRRMVGGPETILVVEDQIDLRSLLSRYLASLGYRVFEASNGEEGLVMLKKQREIDLVFSDLVMPTMNGREMFEKSEASTRGVPFVFCSGYQEAELRDGLVDRAGVTFVAKPFQLEAVAETIREILNAASPDA